MALQVPNTLSSVPKPTPLITGVNPQMSTVTPAGVRSTYAGVAPVQPAPAPKATPMVDMSKVPSEAVAALSSSGLTGSDLTNAQKVLADHYASQVIPQQTATQQTPVQQPAPAAPLISQPNPQPAPVSFGGLLGATAGAGAQAFSQGQQQQQEAYQKAQEAQKQLAQIQKNLATGIGQIGTENIPLQFQQGREQALQSMYGGQEQALATELSGLAGLYGTGVTQQGQGLTALGGAAGAAKPETAAYGQTVFNPVTGQFQSPSGASLDPQTYATQLANAVIGGTIPYADAASSIGYAGGAGKAFLDQALLGRGADINALQAQAAGKQSVLSTLPQLQAANTAAQGIQKTLENFIDQNPDINPNDTAFTNSIQQWIQGQQLTDPRYQTLFNYLSEYTNTLAPILGVGGSPTNLKTEIAQGFLNAQASGQSIKSVLQNISQLADDKVQNIRSGASGGGVVAGGTSPGTQSSADPLGIL